MPGSVNPIREENGQAFYGHSFNRQPVGRFPGRGPGRPLRHVLEAAEPEKISPPSPARNSMIRPHIMACRHLIAWAPTRHPRRSPARSAARRRARARQRALDLEALSPIIASAPLGSPAAMPMPARWSPARSPRQPAFPPPIVEHAFGRVRRGAPGAPARSISTSCCGRAAHWPTSKPTSSSPTRPTARAPSCSAPPRPSPPTGATHSQVWPQNTWLPA
jgi:hypothetical protein